MAEQGRTGFDSQFQDGTLIHQPPLQLLDALPSVSTTYLSPLGNKEWGMPTPFINSISSPAKMEEGIRCRRGLHSEVQI